MGIISKRADRERSEPSDKVVAGIDRIEGIEARQCYNCHTIYPHMQGKPPPKKCNCPNIPLGKGVTKPIKIDIHYGPEGVF